MLTQRLAILLIYYFLFTLSVDDIQIIVKGKFVSNAVSIF